MLVIKYEQNSQGQILDSFGDKWDDEFKASIWLEKQSNSSSS